jgi:hypothetical protein
MYKIARHPIFENQFAIVKDDVTWIPTDEGNSMYQAYLAWVAEGNTAEEWNPNGNQ